MYKKIYHNLCVLSISVLILASAFSLCVCYTSFNSRFKDELRAETQIAASLADDISTRILALQNAAKIQPDKRITLVSKDGIVKYDSASSANLGNDYKDRPEIYAAINEGIGESERRSDVLGRKLCYCAVRLSDGSVLRIASHISLAGPMFYAVLVTALAMIMFIYFLTAVVASRLTENIVKPIKNLAVHGTETEYVYDEIKPFLQRITEQHAEIKRQMSKASSHKARLETIMNNISEGLLIFDSNKTVVSANSYALDAIGTKNTYVKYRNISELTDNSEVLSAIDSASHGKKKNFIIEQKDKTYQAFVSPLVVKNEINGSVMLLFDVSDRTIAEKIRREFTANVSHELKTPLTTIHGYAQVIDNGIARPNDIKGFVKKIEKESARLINLVDDIIRLSHLDEGAQIGEKQSVSLVAVCNEVAESLADKAKEKNIAITVTGSDSQIYAGLSQVTEMIYNIADNAIKYNENNGRVDIVVSERKVIISDTGIGIDEQYLDRIFERFFRVDKSHSKKVNGTGLGLSIVKHLAIANDVDISVNSRLGEGTQFTLVFN